MITQNEEHFVVDVEVTFAIDDRTPRASNSHMLHGSCTDMEAALAWVNRQYGWPEGIVPLDTPHEHITDEHRAAVGNLWMHSRRRLRVRFDRHGNVVSVEDAGETSS